MPSVLKDFRKFADIDLYFSDIDRDSRQHKELVRRIGRDTKVISPGWHGLDTDRNEVGSGCVHFGCWEFKHSDKLYSPYSYDVAEGEASSNVANRGYIVDLLVDSDFGVEYHTISRTQRGVTGAQSRINAVPGDETYNEYLRRVKQAKAVSDTLPYGWFIYLINSSDMQYFCPINFSGSQIVFGGYGVGIGSDKLKPYLREAGKIIQPCFNEVLLLLLRLYLRQDFKSLYEWLGDAVASGDVKLDAGWEPDVVGCLFGDDLLVASKAWGKLSPVSKANLKWDAFSHAMEWVLDCIHFDTIIMNPNRYNKFVDLVRSGNIGKYLITTIKNRLTATVRTHRQRA